MKKTLFAVAGIAVVFAQPLRAQVQVQVTEGTLSLPAYQEGPPNPNPPFDQYASSRFNYPYALRDNLTSKRTERVFRTVSLENEYLKCTVLPDVGGHVYTCTDKINHMPMFYENPSIKEAAIGMRGGWAAFGVEFNFPVSHNWMTVSPVDFAYGKEPDGSASVTVSNIDRVYGMQWTVRLLLHPGSTVLEQQVTLNNRSDVRHRFYWWSNAGVQVWDDTRICYPMRYSAAHGYADVDRWPVDSTGTDLSLVKNQVFGPVSRFVHASREPFMGIWNPKTDAGVAHFADYAELPAKKIWSWGVDADAMDWRKALSDNNSAYMEVQAGLFRNQETYAFLQPRQTIHFTEFWMPLRGLGGLARANLAGAVNLSRSGGALTASLNVNSRMPGATVRLLDGDRVLQTETTDLAPEHTWTKQIANADAERRYTFELRDHEGKVVLAQTEGKYDWTPDAEVHTGPQSVEGIAAAGQRTEDEWVQAGHDNELNGQLLIAAKAYRDGLTLFPRSQALRIALGRLDTALLDYGQASTLLEAAQARDTPNPEIAYYLGLAYDGLGNEEHARTAYETASRVPLMRGAAELRLGELHARKGDLPGAERWLAGALHDAPDDLRTAEELAAVRRARGEDAEARRLAELWFARFPTSYFLAEELGKPETAHLGAEPERVLNVAAEYMRLGRYESALGVLSREYPAAPAGQVEPGSVAPAANPIVGYYRVFCLRKLGRPYQEQEAAASKLSIQYVFPSGAQTEEVLRAAVESNKGDATGQALLGTLLFSVGRTEEAEAHWQSAHDLGAVLPGLDVSRGLSRLYNHADPEGALRDFREGLKNDASNDAVYLGIDQALSMLRRPPAEFIAAMEQYPDKAGMKSELVYELVFHHAEAGEYDQGKDLLRNRFFPREEGGTNVRQVYVELEVERLRAMAEKGQCAQALEGVTQMSRPQSGMSFTADGMAPMLGAAHVRYETALIDRACKRNAEAEAVLKKLADSKEPGDLVWADAAARRLPAYDAAAWRARLTAALPGAKTRAESSSSGAYNLLLLERALGDEAGAAEAYRSVFLTADQKISYHLARTAIAGADAK